jgi:very-short-patch-repair endonuclease
VDPASPMEAKLLGWYKQTIFSEDYFDYVEVIPQFPIGDYLKQIDSDYKHPAYRVDFLLRYYEEEKVHNIIIEYDGFKEHFTNLEEVTADNYQDYYKADDIEREKVLESYGYHIMRVNRFNLGDDPVATLNKRLYKLVERVSDSERSNELIEEINQTQEGLQSGESRLCPKCHNIKPASSFIDKSLKSGKARHCSDCRKPKRRRQRRSYY